MKFFLVFVSCAVALASGSYLHHGSSVYQQHVPVITSEGVPVETPEVQLAKSQHLAAHLHAKVAVGPNSIVSDGLPLDTPEVAAAKQQHYHDFAVAAQRNGVSVGLSSISPVHGYYASGYSYAQIGHDGQPIETSEVQAAKAQHFTAHAEARSRSGAGIHGYYSEGATIGANGQPIETAEVQHAKALHFAALAEARSHSGGVVVSGGVPLDTPEVAAARAQHLAAHYQASSHSPISVYGASYGYHVPVIGQNGVPVETPEVQQATAQHLAAHHAAKQQSHLVQAEQWQW